MCFNLFVSNSKAHKAQVRWIIIVGWQASHFFDCSILDILTECRTKRAITKFFAHSFDAKQFSERSGR